MAGLLMLALGAVNRAAAETFGVAAVVNVPVPGTAPIIATPGANAVVRQSSVLVTGSCPMVTPQVVVDIVVDGILAGTSTCDPTNDFAVPITLASGDHQIVAGSTTISGQAGPDSRTLTVTNTARTEPPVIRVAADSPPTLLGNDRTATWGGSISSSSGSPIFVHIDWGDGTQYNDAIKPGPQNFTHSYSRMASHNILFAVSDTVGNSTVIQYANTAFTTAVPRQPAQVPPLYGTRTMVGLYGLYLTILCVAIITWLEAKHSARHATP